MMVSVSDNEHAWQWNEGGSAKAVRLKIQKPAKFHQ